MIDRPFSLEIPNAGEYLLKPYDNHIIRHLSDMQGLYADPEAYDSILKSGNPILYEVYEVHRPEVTGEMIRSR